MTHTAPIVIVRPPHNLGPVELAIHHYDFGIEVDVRPANSCDIWTPLALVGGTFEVQS